MLALSLLLAKLQEACQGSVQLYCSGHGRTCVDRGLKRADVVNNLVFCSDGGGFIINVYRCLVFESNCLYISLYSHATTTILNIPDGYFLSIILNHAVCIVVLTQS